MAPVIDSWFFGRCARVMDTYRSMSLMSDRPLGLLPLQMPNGIDNGKPETKLEAIEQPEGVLLKRVEQRPSMVKVDGLWVHQGSAEPGANWERILEDVREERIESVLKA
jgi:hypothetical protein